MITFKNKRIEFLNNYVVNYKRVITSEFIYNDLRNILEIQTRI